MISEKYWEAANEGKLLIQRCKSCGKPIFYPRYYCPECLSTDIEWIVSSGKGKLLSYTVIYETQRTDIDPSKMPIVIGLVELEEGVRLITNIVGCKEEELKVDSEVEVTFEDVDNRKLPVFRLKGGVDET